MLNNSVCTKQLSVVCVKHFFNWSHDAIIVGVSLQFSSNSLGKISEFIVFIFSEKNVLHVMLLECFCFKNYKCSNASE